VPYKLAIKKITNSLLSKSSSTTVLPLRQKTGPGTIAPLYMLNHIIRLQAVVKIVTNKMARALNLLTKQNTKMHNAIYQNHLALDYWLLREDFVKNFT
jgi:hypothetical protein